MERRQPQEITLLIITVDWLKSISRSRHGSRHRQCQPLTCASTSIIEVNSVWAVDYGGTPGLTLQYPLNLLAARP